MRPTDAALAGESELQRFFAQGHLIWVGAELDLIEVAHWIATDDAARVADAMDRGTLARASDDQAWQWLEQQAVLWAVVVKPWVLVQEDGCGSGSTPTPVRE